MASASMDGKLFCLGNLLLDIVLTVPEEFLKKYDLEIDSIVLAEEKHLPLFDEIRNGVYPIKYAAGGSALNTTRIAQWILKSPKATTFVGAVGDDCDSTKLLELLDEEGIQLECQKVMGTSTGRCAVLITGSRRTLVTQLGASLHFDGEIFNNSCTFSNFLMDTKVVYISGYFLKASPSTAIKVAQIASSRKCCVVLNLNSTWVVNMFMKELTEILKSVNILLGNISEATAFINQNGFFHEDHYDILKSLSQWLMTEDCNKPPKVVIITRGENNLIVAEGNKITEFPVLKIPKENVVDTNGAGDAFAGGLLAGLVRDNPLNQCIQCGLWAAAEVIQQIGCSFPKEKSLQCMQNLGTGSLLKS